MSDEIGGGFVSTNLGVVYTFPYTRLQSALEFFYGVSSLELGTEETPGAGLLLRDGFKFPETEEAFEHLTVLLTYLHEQFHARHLTASPVGLMLYVLGARQYAQMSHHMKRWGTRVGELPDHEPRLPLLAKHGSDAELRALTSVQSTFATYTAVFQSGFDITIDQAIADVIPPLFEEVHVVMRTALGRPADERYCPVVSLGAGNEPVSLGDLTGEAVLEGLARANEYFTAVSLDAPLPVLNRILTLKHHGTYGLSQSFLENLLGLKVPHVWRVLARLSDWALQAPLFPFLLKGRPCVALPELLPAWRFSLIASRFHQYKFTPDDLDSREREVAEKIFGGLGWDTPWRIAERVREASLSSPKAALTRHYVECLQLGAEVRFTQPAVLSYPQVGDRAHRLGAVYSLFTDGFRAGSTGKLVGQASAWSIPSSLASDAAIDSMLAEENLARPLWVARHLATFLGGSATSGTIVRDQVLQLLGPTTGKRVLSWWANSMRERM